MWVNGTHVASTHASGQWNRPRRYGVAPGVLRPGTNVVAVRVLDTGGVAGLNGKAEQMAVRRDGKRLVPLHGSWRYRKGAAMGDLPAKPAGQEIGPNDPSVLFNGMIAPLVPYGIRGAIWYQGESNRGTPLLYERVFPNMIADWRQQWGGDAFPFYFVQIAPFGYRGDTGQAGALRDAQRLTLSTPNTGMAVTMDIGDPRDIHPSNKRDVGKRLALWALAKTYGVDGLAYSGPLYRSMATEGSTIRLAFDHAEDGLVLRDAPRSYFMIAGADRRFVEARAVVDGSSIVVSSDEVREPVAVRYAWGAADEPNLFNAAGLPASSFRTDRWDLGR